MTFNSMDAIGYLDFNKRFDFPEYIVYVLFKVEMLSLRQFGKGVMCSWACLRNMTVCFD